MILLLAHVAISVREILMWIIGKIVNVVKSISPDAHDVAVCLSLKHLLFNLRFDFYFLIGCFSLKYECCVKTINHKLLQECFWSLVSHK